MKKSELASLLRKKVFVMTGAGISAASGISTFRGSDGLYEGLNPYDLATPQAFRRQPVTVWNWYLMRIHQGKDAQPNAALELIRPFEPEPVRDSLKVSKAEDLGPGEGPKGVVRAHPGYTFFDT